MDKLLVTNNKLTNRNNLKNTDPLIKTILEKIKTSFINLLLSPPSQDHSSALIRAAIQNTQSRLNRHEISSSTKNRLQHRVEELRKIKKAINRGKINQIAFIGWDQHGPGQGISQYDSIRYFYKGQWHFEQLGSSYSQFVLQPVNRQKGGFGFILKTDLWVKEKIKSNLNLIPDEKSPQIIKNLNLRGFEIKKIENSFGIPPTLKIPNSIEFLTALREEISSAFGNNTITSFKKIAVPMNLFGVVMDDINRIAHLSKQFIKNDVILILPQQATAIEYEHFENFDSIISTLNTVFDESRSDYHHYIIQDQLGAVRVITSDQLEKDRQKLHRLHQLGQLMLPIFQGLMLAALVYGMTDTISATPRSGNRLGRAFGGTERLTEMYIIEQFIHFFISIVFIFGGLATKKYLSDKELPYHILSNSKKSFKICTAPIKQNSLIGTIETPGLLPQSIGGVLAIDYDLLDSDSREIINSVLSNGAFNMASFRNKQSTRIPFYGTILLGMKQDQFKTLPAVATQSGRIKLWPLPTQNSPNLTPVEANNDSEYAEARNRLLHDSGWQNFNYHNIPSDLAKQLQKSQPFLLTVGRDKEVKQIRNALHQYIESLTKEENIRRFSLYISDQNSNSLPPIHTYGIGKTSLTKLAVAEANRLLDKRKRLLPGLAYIRNGDEAHPIILNAPISPSHFFFGINPKLRVAELLISSTQQLWMLSAQLAVFAYRSGPGAFRLGFIESAMGLTSMIINIGGLLGSWWIDRQNSNFLPNILSNLGPHYQLRELHSATYPVEDWIGCYNVPSSHFSPQNRFVFSDSHQNILGGNPFGQASLFESEATEKIEDDPQLLALLKTVISSGKLATPHTEINRLSQLFFFTANSQEKSKEIATICTHKIELYPKIPYEKNITEKLIFILLKIHNEDQNLLPWSSKSLEKFISRIKTEDGKEIFLTRLYFQDLLPAASFWAKQNNHSQVEIADFELAFIGLRYRFGSYINQYLNLPDLTQDELDSLNSTSNTSRFIVEFNDT